MPAPKEKPKGRAPREKRGGFIPKEAGRIVREKYRQMAEQRQPEESPNDHAVDRLEDGIAQGAATAADLADRGRSALRSRLRETGAQRTEPAPQPEHPPESSQAPSPQSPQEQGRAPREQPASAGRSGGAMPKERDLTTPEMRPNLGRISDTTSRAAFKERSVSTERSGGTMPKERKLTTPEMRPNLGRISDTPSGMVPKARPASAGRSGGVMPKERDLTTPEMRPNLGRISDTAHQANPRALQSLPGGRKPCARTAFGTYGRRFKIVNVQGKLVSGRTGEDNRPVHRPNKQDLKKRLAKERARAQSQPRQEIAPANPGADLSGVTDRGTPPSIRARYENTPTARAARVNNTHEWIASPRHGGRAPRIPKTGRPVPGGGRSVKKETAKTLLHPVQAMRQQLKRRAAKKAVQKGTQKAAAHVTKKSANAAANLTLKVVRAAVRAVAALFSALVGLLGGGVLIAIVLVIAIAGALISSPFGILFSNQDHTPGVIPVSLAVGQINQAFSSYLDRLQTAGSYDSVEIHGDKADWVEVLAVFAVKTALYDGEDAADVVTLDAGRVDRLSGVFWDMNPVRTWVEEIYHPPTLEEPGWMEYILHIYIESKTAEEMKEVYGFTSAQTEALDELLEERALLEWLLSDLSVSDETAREVLENLPEDISPERRAAVEKALELVGKVSYFWGGKSYATGWDERWGQLTQVTAPGSSSTGSYLPFGLDCTGFLDWSFRNAGLQSDGHWYLESNLTEITWAESLPGDIVLYPDDSHVGLVVGRDAGGRVLVVHCSYSLNNVAISDGQAFGFTKVGRPSIYGDT